MEVYLFIELIEQFKKSWQSHKRIEPGVKKRQNRGIASSNLVKEEFRKNTAY